MSKSFKILKHFVLCSFIALVTLILLLGLFTSPPTPRSNPIFTEYSYSLSPLGSYDLWQENGTSICNSTNDQNTIALVSDGSGGAILCWADYRNGSEYDIYAQRVNSMGIVQWVMNGVPICNAPNDQINPKIVGDGNGGAIIVWEDLRDGSSFDLYAQRINSSGVVQWTVNGVPVSTAFSNQYRPAITTDGAGGAIIAWQDFRSGSDYDIYAQRINSLGVVQWTVNGVPVSTAVDQQVDVKIILTSSNKSILVWTDQRSGLDRDIYAQQLNQTGGIEWTINGVAITTATGSQRYPQLVADGADGAIIVWDDYRASNYDIYAQRINSTGVVQWIVNGTAICSAVQTQVNPRIVEDDIGGAIITWEDFRTGAAFDIYAQRINHSGQVQWTPNGVPVCTENQNQANIQLVSDGSEGAIIVWEDLRTAVDKDIYSQRINSTGHIQWSAQSEKICNLPNNQENPVLVASNSMGAIIAWEDNRTGLGLDIYAQRVSVKAILDGTTNATSYKPGQIMQVQANFTFNNGTPIEGATIGFLLRSPDLTPLSSKANFTDGNGIATQSFFIEPTYNDGTYTLYITASKGTYSANKTIPIYVNATTLQITMDSQYLIGDIITVDAYFGFSNGTPITNAICAFALRNASGPLQNKADFTDGTGIATQNFGTTGYGEGWYEMYVTATKGNYSQVVNQTFFITAYDGPIIKSPILTPNPPAYNQSALVNVSIGVPPHYASITGALLSYYNGTGWYNVTMTNITIPDGNGYAYWTGTIPPHSWNLQISYKIWAIDSLGNQSWNDNSGQLFNYTVTDLGAPIISIPTWTTPVSYNTTVNVIVHITEDPTSPTLSSGVHTVILYYQTGSSPSAVFMGPYNGSIWDGYWTANIPPHSYASNVSFWIFANDSAGNSISGAINNYVVGDFWGPTITNVLIDNVPIAFNMTANVTCRIQEPTTASGVQSTFLYYRVEGGGWNSVVMTRYSGDQFDGLYTGLIPTYQYGFLIEYYIWANDIAGNPSINDNESNYYSYVVDDFTPPVISEIWIANIPITYNDSANITCRIQELSIPTVQSTVDTPILRYHDGISWKNLTMTRYSGNAADGYYFALIPTLDYGTLVQFWIWCNDSAGNVNYDDNSGTYYSFTVIDLTPPTISAVTVQNAPIAYNMTANITCRVQEPTLPANSAGTDTAILIYRVNTGSWTNATMTRISGTIYDGIYSAFIPQQNYTNDIEFYIWVNDSAGNSALDDAAGLYYSYQVDDFWSPSISEITTNVPVEYYETAIVTCRVQEPSAPTFAAGTDTVILSYSVGAGWNNLTMNRFAGNAWNGQYQAFITPLPYNTLVQYLIYYNDSAGNSALDDNNSNYYSYLIQDFIPPTINNPIQNDSIIEYTEAVLITVQVTEPTAPSNAAGIPLSGVILSYWAGASWTNLTMPRISGTIYDGQYQAIIPAQSYGIEVAYKIYAQDNAGNWNLNDNSGNLFNYTVTDVTPPTIYLASPPNGSIISGIAPFNILDSDALDVDVDNLTVIYRYNTSSWIVHGSYFDGINMTWNPGGTTTILINLSSWVPGTGYTIQVTAQDLRDFISAPSSIYSIEVSNYTGPIVYNIQHLPDPPGYNESVTVSCTVFVPESFGQIDTVNLHYYNGMNWNIVAMSNTTPRTVGIPTDFAAAIPQFTLGTQVSYWIFANDTNGNSTNADNYGAYYNYTVSDKWAPFISQITIWNSPIIYGEVADIRCRVQEPAGASGTDHVILYYNNGSGWYSIIASRYQGDSFDGLYAGLVPAFPYGTVVQFWFQANDTAGNIAIEDNSSNYYSYVIDDFANPTISEVTVLNAPIGNNMTANISCRAVEPLNAAGIASVILYYNNGTGVFTVSMIRYSGTIYDGNYSALIPKAPFGTTVQFWIFANDTAGNSVVDNNAGNNYSYFVIDFVPPAAVTGLTAVVYTGAKTINISWTENIEPDLSYYRIHRALTAGFSPNPSNYIANTTNTSYLDIGLTDKIQYFYIVIAVDISGLNSSYTLIVNGTPTSEVNLAEFVQIYSNTHTYLNISDAHLILDFTAGNTFTLTVNTLSSYNAFEGHKFLMNFYINITLFGTPGTVSGTISLILDATIIAALSENVDSSSFAIYYWDGDSWEQLTSIYYESNQTLTATITHFSIFGAFASLVTPGGFPIEILIVIIIGAIAGVALVVGLSKRKKHVIPTDAILSKVKQQGYVKIQDLGREFNQPNSTIIEILETGIQQSQIRGFFANKRKEFITIDRLKEELTKKLEGE
ncbi:MAG: hypothetical protein ACTSRS_05210 [Candidatus Helarchaeota archaeon]